MSFEDVTLADFGNPGLCHCQTFSDNPRWNTHGYCSYCGGFAPSVFRAAKGEDQLKKEIAKLAEHDREAMNRICFTSFKTHEQAMACTSCGLAGMTPNDAFPLKPGIWWHHCPKCGEFGTVWVTEVRERRERPEGEDLQLAKEHLAKAEVGIKTLVKLNRRHHNS